MKSSSIHFFRRKRNAILAFVGASAFLTMSFQNCSPANSVSFNKVYEQIFESTILSNPGTEEVTNMCKALIATHELVDCSLPVELANGTFQDRRQYERERALALAAADSTLVPISIAYSFGQAMDNVADIAHKRAVLSNDRGIFVHQGQDFTVIPTSAGGVSSNYYRADVSAAKARYATGETCFYDVAQINSPRIDAKASSGYYDFLEAIPNTPVNAAQGWGLHHVANYMIYGYCDAGAAGSCADNNSRYGAGSYGKDIYPNRILAENAPAVKEYYENGQATGNSEIQFIKVYFADLRDKHFKLSNANNHIIRTQEHVERGHESSVSVNDFIDMDTLLLNFETAAENISQNYTDPETNITFSGMAGSKQLLANLCAASVSGTTLATQYTPIVVDLGVANIVTTSIKEGVAFDMAGSGQKTATAWLGGRPRHVQDVNSEGQTYLRAIESEVEDGFLVIPNNDGSVTSSKNLFGSNMTINGRKHINGYEALMSLAKKNCRSSDLKDQYFGPWDGDLYSSKVRVWVDKNKNGVSDSGEVISLREAGVAAVSACYTNRFGMTDTFGNETALRSIMAYQKPVTISEQNLLDFLSARPGQDYAPLNITKRLSIDVILKGAAPLRTSIDDNQTVRIQPFEE